MTELARRLEMETEREESPWEVANKPYESRRSLDYSYRVDNYFSRGSIDDYSRISDVYA